MGACSSSSAVDDRPNPSRRDENAAAPSQIRAKSGMSNAAARADLFVTRQGSSLHLGGQPFRFAGFNAPELLDGDVNGPFEVRDTFASLAAENGFGGVPVTRTYTMRVKSGRIGRGHINGFSTEWGDWMWDSDRLREMDVVLDEAYKAGVKLIIPLINDDTGEESNWVGSTADLIRFRYGLNSNDEARKIDWFTDPVCIESMKLIIDFLLNRVNSINGRKYSEDPTILAWETGNELNYRGMRPAPASWTLTIARHLKARGKQLVMDGSFARADDPESCYNAEVLESPDVDILSYHYYGDGDARRVKRDIEISKRHNKVFVAGEFGFFSSPRLYADFLTAVDSAGGAGSLVWSLRPHSSRGGYKTHCEDGSNWSYHIPGSKERRHNEFDPREQSIVSAIRSASFKINGQKPPSSFPIPSPPSRPWQVQHHPQGFAVAFQGSAWAARYQVIIRSASGTEQSVDACDDTKEGEFAVVVGSELQACAGQGGVRVTVRAIGVDGGVSGESEELVVKA